MFGLFKKKKAAPTGPDRSTLVPRIKSLQFTAALKGMDMPADQMPYTEPFAADLLVTYAFDLPHMFQMATGADIAELGIPLSDVREIAVANLKQQLPQIGIEEHGPCQRIVTGENLEACTLLASRFWKEVAEEMDDEVVAAVPNRDVVLFCSRRSEQGLAGLRALVAEILEEEATHNLTERLLVWRGDRWTEFS